MNRSRTYRRKRLHQRRLASIMVLFTFLFLSFQNCGPSFESAPESGSQNLSSSLESGVPTPTVTPMPTASPGATPKPTVTPGPTATPKPTATPSAPTPTPVASVQVGTEIALGAGLNLNQYQTDLRVNPLNPQQMAVSMKTGFQETETAIATSRDGGATWTFVTQPQSGDPDCFYDTAGNLHYIFIDKSASSMTGHRRSTDGGLTFSAKTNPGSNAVDHEHIVVDHSAGPYRGSIYFAGRNFANNGVSVTISRDNGLTWKRVSLPYSNGLQEGFVYGMTVLSDGTLLIPMETKNIILSNNGVYAGSSRDVYVLRSTDGGATFGAHFIQTVKSPAKQGPGGFRAQGNLSAGPKPGGGQRVYLCNVQDQVAPKGSSLMLLTSDDGGKTFSAPREIVAGTSAAGAGACSTMTKSDGTVGIQYYWIGADSSTFDLHFVYSKDAGTSFAPPIRISSMSSVSTNSQPRWMGQDQVYSDVSSTGVFHLVWTDDRTKKGQFTTYMRKVQTP